MLFADVFRIRYFFVRNEFNIAFKSILTIEIEDVERGAELSFYP